MGTPQAYIVVGPLRVDDLSGTHPDIISGYPMPTAVAGFGYKIVLDLNRDMNATAFAFAGAAVIVHSHSMQGGHPKNPVVGTDATKGAPVVDEFKARAELSFIIGVESLAKSPSEEAAHFRAVEEKVSKRLPGWFFGGGKVFVGNGKAFSDLVSFETGDEGLFQRLKKTPPGFVLVDRRDLLEQRLVEGAADTLDALLDLLEFTSLDRDGNVVAVGEDKKKVDVARRVPGWLVPLLVGYQGIERPQIRQSSRVNDGTTLHVYAESLYSVGEYKSLHALLASETLESCFWSHRKAHASETYYVSALESV